MRDSRKSHVGNMSRHGQHATWRHTHLLAAPLGCHNGAPHQCRLQVLRLHIADNLCMGEGMVAAHMSDMSSRCHPLRAGQRRAEEWLAS